VHVVTLFEPPIEVGLRIVAGTWRLCFHADLLTRLGRLAHLSDLLLRNDLLHAASLVQIV